jgi:hypothetical protein
MRRLRSFLTFTHSRIVRPMGRTVGELLGVTPALLTAAGVFLVVAGLFYYLQPASADSVDAGPTLPAQSAAPYSLPPLAHLSPSAGDSVSAAIATRVTIPALGIDLPVVAPPANEEFPLCNAAEYAILDKPMAFPGLSQATYLYAHARTAGMFWPLLVQSKINNGAAMIGMWVEVYTADNQRHVYQISQVVRHVPNASSAFDGAIAATHDQLWLQTSEGTIKDPFKMQVVADPVGVLAASAADAHPTGQGNVCPDAPKCKSPTGGGCIR